MLLEKVDELLSKVRPLGMNLIIKSSQEIGISKLYDISLIHPKLNKRCNLKIVLPIFENNIIQWNNCKKALLCTATINHLYEIDAIINNKQIDSIMNLIISNPKDIFIRSIEGALSEALTPWFKGYDKVINETNVQTCIDSWFSTGIQWRMLKDSNIAENDQNNGLIILTDEADPDHATRMLNKLFNKDLRKKIDLCSTSIGDTINETFRLCIGANIKNNSILEGTSIFSKNVHNHGIGINFNPRRTHLIKNTFEQSLELVNPEEPIVTPYDKDYKESKLQGINFNTAIMNLGYYTHEDSIVISTSAAKKFDAFRYVIQLIESAYPINLFVKIGDIVDPNMIIGESDENIYAHKLYSSGIIEEIKISKGIKFSKQINIIWIKYKCVYSLENGDKISNRHGSKGVITILDDNKMPHDIDNNVIDLCISPESIISRKSLSILYEMALTKKAEKEHLSNILVKSAWDEQFTYNDLANQFSINTQLYINNIKLPYTTFVSKLFWLRLDKLAKEIISSVSNKKVNTNIYNMALDNAKISGQRCNIAKLLAMISRNWETVAYDIIDDNMSGKNIFNEIIKAINYGTFES